MGSTNAAQDWRNDYQLVAKSQFDPNKITLKNKVDQYRYQLVTLYLSDKKDIDWLIARLKKRQANKSRYLLPIEKVYHKEDSNLCGNNLRYEIIIPQTESTLQDHFNYRKIKQEPFTHNQIMYVIQNTSLALKDLQSIQDQHGIVTLNSLIINNDLLLEDPIISGSKTPDNQAYLTKKVVGYPSPAILFNQYDSGMRIDKFKEDLFSVGIIALQLLYPLVNIKAIYHNKNRKYENPRINFEILIELVNNVQHHTLRQWIVTLVHQTSEERTKIYSLIEKNQIDRNQLKLLKENPRMITPQQQLAQSQQPPLPQQIITKQPISHPQYPRPELTLKTYPSQATINSGSSLSFNYNPAYNKNKIQFRPISLTRAIETQPKLQEVHYNIPNFNKDITVATGVRPLVVNQAPGIHTNFNIHSVYKQQKGQAIPMINLPSTQINNAHGTSLPNNISETLREYPKISGLQTKNSQHYLQNYYQQIPNYRQVTITQTYNTHNLNEQEPTTSLPQTQRPQNIKQQIKQQLTQLQKLTRQNQQLQKKININATNMFQTSFLPLPHQEIRQVTEEDSKVQQSSFVIQNYEDGTKYEGFVRDHLRNGYGKFFYKSGSIYDGEWKNNLMNGYGTLYYPEGKIAYQGYWENDQFNGKGVIYNDNPQIIRGNFDYTDFRKLEPDQWQTYEGECKDSKKHRKGKWTLSNMETYEGEFVMDVPHGSGVFTQLRGNKIKGVWSDGQLRTIVD